MSAGHKLKLLCNNNGNSTIHHDTFRGMVLYGKNNTVHLSHQKSNDILCQRKHYTSTVTKIKFIKHLTKVKSPVKNSIGSSRLNHSTLVIFQWKNLNTVNTDLAILKLNIMEEKMLTGGFTVYEGMSRST
jgi:hypothetical protein